MNLLSRLFSLHFHIYFEKLVLFASYWCPFCFLTSLVTAKFFGVLSFKCSWHFLLLRPEGLSLVAQLVRKILWRRDRLPTPVFLGFPGGSNYKESACNARCLGSTPGLGGSLGEGNGYPFEYSCLENSIDKGTWQATVHGVTKNQTRLSDFHFLFTSEKHFQKGDHVLNLTACYCVSV